MAKFSVVTNGNSDPHGKPRVYFTCHPDDFELYSKEIFADVLKAHDCAIYYTADMTEEIPEEDTDTDLGTMNLFIVPITYKLLTLPCRAMDHDIAYAKSRNRPILTFMMEPGLDSLYSMPKYFGERQYLNPNSRDITEISYKDKLKKRLDDLLISDELAVRVRAAFDAYIFLSYRKKDRRYANELMSLIHQEPEYRDIAIWYDEFLTPGESFKKNIEKALHDSELFTLLVTPNVLEDVDGKPNFIRKFEYPEAKKTDKRILPAEMVRTDRSELKNKFEGIPTCISTDDDSSFKAELALALSHIVKKENDVDPEHNFLIGIAYFEGVDVERNTERGLELIRSAAEAGYAEAMETLAVMYRDGTNVQTNYGEAIKWGRLLVEKSVREFGAEHPNTLDYVEFLALSYRFNGDYKCSLELNEKVYTARRQILGDEHHDTLVSLNNIADDYINLGEYDKGVELNEKVYSANCKIFGEEHKNTATSALNLGASYSHIGNHKKALELTKKAYEICVRIYGEEHLITLTCKNNLAFIYNDLGKRVIAFDIFKEVYSIGCKTLGEEHPQNLTFLNNIATAYSDLGNYVRALETHKKVYEYGRRILGEDHPDTVISLSNIAYTYHKLGENEKALALSEKALALSSRIYGLEHPDTATVMNTRGLIYNKKGEYKKASELHSRVYSVLCKSFGEAHGNAITCLISLADDYLGDKNYPKALECLKKAYAVSSRVFGEEDISTLKSLANFGVVLGKMGNYKKAYELIEKAYNLHVKVLGKYNPDTLAVLDNFAFAAFNNRDYAKAIGLQERLYTSYCKTLSSFHPDTVEAKRTLDLWRLMF